MCAAIACGAKENDRPRGVRASADASGIEVSRQAVTGARAYRVQLADLDTREQRGEPVVVSATSAHLEGAFSRSLGVWVDALLPDRTARGVGFLRAGASGGSGASWQMFRPPDFPARPARAAVFALRPGWLFRARYGAQPRGWARPRTPTSSPTTMPPRATTLLSWPGWAARSRSVCCPRATPPSARPPT